MDKAVPVDGRRIKGFDGVRGLSAVAVVAQHTAFTFSYIGETAVYLFFALSGFLIMGLLQRGRLSMEEVRSTFGAELVHFWLGRALRIFPVYYLALAVMVAVGYFVASEAQIRTDLAWYLTYLQNYQIGLYAREWGSFSHTWTLAIEQQFYLLFGVVFLAVGLRHHRTVILVAIAGALAGYLISMQLGLPAILTHTLPGLGFCFILAGCYARTVPFTRVRVRCSPVVRDALVMLLGLAIVAVSLLPMVRGAHWSVYLPVPEWSVKVVLIGACALFLWCLAAFQDGWAVRLLEWRPIRYVGLVSYALYVVHFPLSWLGAWLIERYAGLQDFAATVNFFFTLVVGLALSALSYHGLEKPAARLRPRLAAALRARRNARPAEMERARMPSPARGG